MRDMTDPQAGAVMIKIANGYEHLATLTARDAPKIEQRNGPEPSETRSTEYP